MPATIDITETLRLPENELQVTFIRSSGPGGQNVNKVATAVQLRFDLMGSPSLPDGVKHRAAKRAGSRLTAEGEIVITASSFRTQALNRDDAIARLRDLLRSAAYPPKRRVPTKPSLAAKRKRRDAKARRGVTKKLRQSPTGID